VSAAIRGQAKRDRARSAAPTAYPARLVRSASSRRSAYASATGSCGGTRSPVIPSATTSGRQPVAAATTGTPQAIASSATVPAGSYHGVHTIASALRSSAGSSARPTWPVKITRSATPLRSASATSRGAWQIPPCAPGSGPPTISSSASGTWRSALIAVPNPAPGVSRPTATSRGRRPRGTAGPCGLNHPTSTPRGTTTVAGRRTPVRTSSSTSCLELASTPATLRPIAASSRIRCRGPVSGSGWCRRNSEPSEWNVCTTGIGSSPTPISAASPDSQ